MNVFQQELYFHQHITKFNVKWMLLRNLSLLQNEHGNYYMYNCYMFQGEVVLLLYPVLKTTKGRTYSYSANRKSITLLIKKGQEQIQTMPMSQIPRNPYIVSRGLPDTQTFSFVNLKTIIIYIFSSNYCNKVSLHLYDNKRDINILYLI